MWYTFRLKACVLVLANKEFNFVHADQKTIAVANLLLPIIGMFIEWLG